MRPLPAWLAARAAARTPLPGTLPGLPLHLPARVLPRPSHPTAHGCGVSVRAQGYIRMSMSGQGRSGPCDIYSSPLVPSLAFLRSLGGEGAGWGLGREEGAVCMFHPCVCA